MNYKEYQKARNLSWLILIHENITELPINIVSLCKQLGIEVKYCIPANDSDGECTIVDNVPYILLKENCSMQRKRFTIAHELGHLLLGHVGKHQLINREPLLTDNPIEQAANVFASRLLAPACVLWKCRVRNAEEIVQLCDISYQAAEYRMQRMHKLCSRNKFLTSPLEQQVLNQFKDFILNHQHRGDF